MYHLATVFPFIRKLPIPLKRCPIMMLMLALNMLLLGAETYSAHIISGTIRPGEWIPIIFGPVVAFFLLLLGWLSLRKSKLSIKLVNPIFIASIIVGLLGEYFHLQRGLLPYAPVGQKVTVALLIWGPPVLAPLTFALLGLIGLSTVWVEDPVDSGCLVLFNGKRIQMPLSRTRAFFLIVGMGCLSTVISSVLDHTRTGFENPLLWIPTLVGLIGTIVPIMLGFIRTPGRGDLITYTTIMILMIFTGMLGSYLHIRSDLTASGSIIIERLIRGAPIMAPMLFADMGAFGLIALLDPNE